MMEGTWKDNELTGTVKIRLITANMKGQPGTLVGYSGEVKNGQLQGMGLAVL